MASLTFITLVVVFEIASAASQHEDHGRFLRSTEDYDDEYLDCGFAEYSKEGNMPWNARIFKKLDNKPQNNRYICRGTLVKPQFVISVANCVTSIDGKPSPASNYAVSFRNENLNWYGSGGEEQTLDVSAISIPPRYRGHATNFQYDISILKLSQAIMSTGYALPACITFDRSFESQLTNNYGKFDFNNRTLQATYMPTAECVDKSPKEFVPYVTADKFCARINDSEMADSNLQGIGGTGIVFPRSFRQRRGDSNSLRYFVVGFASTAPPTEDRDKGHTLIAFTRFIDHDLLIKKALFDSEEL